MSEDDEFAYPLESLAEVEEGDALTIAVPDELQDEVGKSENRLEVADVFEKNDRIVRLSFHSAGVRLWQVNDHLFLTDKEDEQIEGTEGLMAALAEKVLGTEYDE